ncbi:hypothetical protein ACIQZN_12065 [Streptomyces sp. NPDC097595]
MNPLLHPDRTLDELDPPRWPELAAVAASKVAPSRVTEWTWGRY